MFYFDIALGHIVIMILFLSIMQVEWIYYDILVNKILSDDIIYND